MSRRDEVRTKIAERKQHKSLKCNALLDNIIEVDNDDEIIRSWFDEGKILSDWNSNETPYEYLERIGFYDRNPEYKGRIIM